MVHISTWKTFTLQAFGFTGEKHRLRPFVRVRTVNVNPGWVGGGESARRSSLARCVDMRRQSATPAGALTGHIPVKVARDRPAGRLTASLPSRS